MKGRRFLAGIVGLAMLTSAFSFGVFADNDAGEDQGSNTSGQETTYQITNEIDWEYTSVYVEGDIQVTSAAPGTKVYVAVNMEFDSVIGETGETKGLMPVVHVTGADGTEIGVDDSDYRNYTFTFMMPEQAVTITADFKPAIATYQEGYSLDISVNGKPAYCADPGEIVTVTTPMHGNATFYDYQVVTRDADNTNEHPIDIIQQDGYFTFEMPDNLVIITAMPKIVGYQLTLNGAFELNFCVTLPENVEAKDAYVLFEVGPKQGDEYTINRRNQVRLSEDDKDEYGAYWVTCTVNPLELADTITATLYSGNKPLISPNQVTAHQYLNRVYQKAIEENNEALMSLLDSLMNYAGILYKLNAMDEGWTDGRTHTNFPPTARLIEMLISESGTIQLLDKISNVCDETEVYGIQKDSVAEASIEDVKLSLTMRSMNAINVYVKPVDGVQILSTPVDTIEIDEETYYQFDSRYLKPTELGTPIAFEIETTSGTATIYVSAMSYVHVGIKKNLGQGGTRFVKNLALALFYDYYQAAVAYQNAQSN